MRKMLFFVLAGAASLVMIPAQNAQAQSETPKVEIGMHYSHLRLRDFGTGDHGVGFRLTLNVTDAFGIEGEVNSFPRGRDNLAAPTGFSIGSQRVQGLFGVKYGMRSEMAGIFGKIRPGFMRFTENEPSIPFIPPTPGATEFALDIGRASPNRSGRNCRLWDITFAFAAWATRTGYPLNMTSKANRFDSPEAPIREAKEPRLDWA